MRIKNMLTDNIVMDAIILLFGMVLLTQFYALLFQHNFIEWTNYLTNISHSINNESWRMHIMSLLLATHDIGGMIFGLLMISSAISCVLLIERSMICLSVGTGFFLAWILMWSYPGMWTFEFLFPAVFAFIAGLSKVGYPMLSPSIFHKMGISRLVSILSVAVVSALLWYVTSIAYNDPALAKTIAYASAGSFFILLLFQILIFDKLFDNQEKQAQTSVPCLDIMIIVIGAMMIMQVYSNHFSGLFEIKNYKNLIIYYSTASNTYWLHSFLQWSADHSDILMPLQIIFETFVAICLTTLIIRGPVLLMTTMLFAILAFAELGVSADWPPVQSNLTWEWELLLVTGVSLFIGIKRSMDLFNVDSFKQKILGPKLYTGKNLLIQIMIAALSGLALYSIGIVTRVFGDTWQSISIYSGITFFVLLVILAVIDRYR